MNNTLADLSVKQLNRAIKIKGKLEVLQAELNQIFGGEIPIPAKGKRRMSAAGRAAIAAGQKARWAKVKRNGVGQPAKKGRRKMSAASRVKMSAVAKARWKAAKVAGKSTL